MPSKLSRVLSVELKLGYYLIKWVFQQDRLAADEYTYHKKSAAMALTFALIFVTPVAIVLLAVILSQDWLTWVLSIAAIYGLYWTVGLYASMVALPHKLGADAFIIRYGALASVNIPYADIETAELSLEGIAQGGDGLKFDDRAPIAYFSVGSTTRIKLSLRQPVTPELWRRPTQPVSTIFLNADRPDLLVERLQEKSGTAAG
jgi:hypothetical protein